VVAFTAAWTQSSQAAILFTHTADLVTAAPTSRGVAAGDFNRDGVPDLVLTGDENPTGSVSVFLGHGDGTFAPRTTYPLPYGALAVAAADVNSDTFPDLVVGTNTNLALLLGNGDGSFAPATELESLLGVTFVSFADLNADGRPDIVASTAFSALIRLGNGDGTFRPAIEIPFPDCVYGEVLHGDFNGDVRTDLAVIRGCADVVSVLLGNGDGTFQSPVDYRVTHSPNAGDVGDLNSDGRLDLAIVGTQSSTVSVLMGNGDGTFTPGATIATGDTPIDAALGDLNSDNIPDLVVAVYFGSSVEVSAGRGDGTFEPKTGYATGITPSVALGDWDRDGLLDIAASNWGGALPASRISLFRNTSVRTNGPPTLNQPADMTVNESAMADQTLTGSDPDGDALTFTKVVGPVFMTVTNTNATTGNVHLAPGFTDAGTYSATVRASDASLSDDKSLTITVNDVPGPPILAPIANMSVAPGATADQGISATDPDGDAITFTSSGPAFMTLTSNAQVGNTRTGNIHLAPPLGTTGTFPASVTATADTQSASQSFTVTARENQPPAITAPATASGGEGCSIATMTATATDPDASNTLTITQTGKPASLTFTGQAPGPSPRTATITGTPGFGSAGSYTIVWTVNDGTGATNATASTTTVLTISPNCPNRQPAITAPATASGAEGTPIATITATATDADANNVLTITQVGKPASLTFTAQAPGPSPRTATITGIPTFTDAGSYSIVFTVNDGTGTTNATASTTTVLTICGGCSSRPAITAPATASGAEGTPIATITATATDADAANNLTITQAGKPVSLTFTAQAAGPSPRTATISGTTTFTDAGTYSIVWTVNDGTGTTNATASTTTVLNVGGPNRQPVITAPATASGMEGSPIATITAAATDPDGTDNLTITQAGKPVSLTFTAQAAGPSPRTAQITGTPAFGIAGTYSIVWTVNDGTGVINGTASTTTVLTIASGQNRCPVANPDGPYSGITGAPISFNGTGSSDPDGDPLTYAWDFGDGSTANGPTPVHTYPVAASFMVTLTVTDNGHGDPTQACIGTAATTATIMPACPATVFNGYDVIKLATGRPTWFAFVQPGGGCYANTDVVFSSFVLKYAGSQISADARKTSVGGDRSGDGIEEIRVSFLKTDLRTLFAALPNGHNVVEVTIEANLATGGILQGTTQVDVVSSGSMSAALIAPNPMNPAATLTFTTTRSGSAKVEMFDIGGRLVRTILDEGSLTAGEHEVWIDGRGRRGESLASGIYFIRGVSADGEFKQTIAILK
jgi:hypothetical protein